MLYHSMSTVALLTVLMTIILISIGTGRNPFAAAYHFVKELLTSWKFLLLFLSMAGVLLINKYEQLLERHMSYQKDFTPFFFKLEGHFVQHFQQFFHAAWVSDISAFFYVIILQSMLIASIGIFAGQHNKVYLYASCLTVLLNYAIAIPFFLFFPITEVWAFPPAGVTFYMLEAYPRFEVVYRPMSGLDNCFPSLHTSVSVSMAILAVRSGNRRWAGIACTFAAIILFTIFYMGIHWLTDMLGGLVLAGVSTTLAVAFAKRIHADDVRQLLKVGH